jgi:hypothetical protein
VRPIETRKSQHLYVQLTVRHTSCFFLSRAIISCIIQGTSNDRQLLVCNILIKVEVCSSLLGTPMPQVLVRHLTPRDLTCPTLTDRLLSPLLQNKIGRYARWLFHYVCVLIGLTGRQSLHYVLITNALHSRGAQIQLRVTYRKRALLWRSNGRAYRMECRLVCLVCTKHTGEYAKS